MAIDTSMYGNIKPMQIENPLTQFAKISQIQNAQNQNRLADLMFGEKERGIADERAMNKLYQEAVGADGKFDRAKMFTGAAQGGQGAKIPGLMKAFAEQDKSTADLEKVRFETITKKLDLAGQAFGYVRNNPTIEVANQVLDSLGANGVYSSEQVAQYKAKIAANPSSIKALADQAFTSVLSAKDQLPKIETRNTGATTDTLSIDPVTQQARVINTVANTQSPDSVASTASAAAGRAVTIRGQNMTDARAKETLAAGGKAPAGYRWSADGTKMEAIPGGPAEKDKAPTEFQGKSAGFGARAEEADKILGSLESKGVTNTGIIRSVAQGAGEMIPFMGDKVGAAIGSGMNTLPGFLGGPSGDQQRVDQARRDFVNAVLRQESGAAIAQSEFENASRQYFPQPGDTPEVIAQKGRNRKLAIQGFKNNAGKAGFTAPAQQDVFSQADAILKGK